MSHQHGWDRCVFHLFSCNSRLHLNLTKLKPYHHPSSTLVTIRLSCIYHLTDAHFFPHLLSYHDGIPWQSCATTGYANVAAFTSSKNGCKFPSTLSSVLHTTNDDGILNYPTSTAICQGFVTGVTYNIQVNGCFIEWHFHLHHCSSSSSSSGSSSSGSSSSTHISSRNKLPRYITLPMLTLSMTLLVTFVVVCPLCLLTPSAWRHWFRYYQHSHCRSNNHWRAHQPICSQWCSHRQTIVWGTIQ